jgi:hypothetical protein
MKYLRCVTAVLVWSCAIRAIAEEASLPQGVTLSLYDAGFGLVNETRRVNFPRGESEIVIRQVPARLDPSTAALTLPSGERGLDLVDLRFEHDLAKENGLLTRYLGRTIRVIADGQVAEGPLLAAPVRTSATGEKSPVVIRADDGGARAFFDPRDIRAVEFPGAAQGAFLDPTLIWSVRSDQAGLRNVRLAYMVEGLSWRANHELVLSPGGESMRLSSRVSLQNESGGRFADARARLLATEEGAQPVARAPVQRFAYGRSTVGPEQSAAALNTIGAYELPHAVTLEDGQIRHYSLLDAADVPVNRFYVYDGVRFDRFQRNQQSDWNYGTEHDPTVSLHVEFQLAASAPGVAGVPGGTLRVFQQREDGTVDFLGQDRLSALRPGETNSARIGPARGLVGARERTGFSEVRPFHEYDESFEIRLSNLSDQPVQIRVVEHLYRSADFTILKSDAEYVASGPRTIEFRPDLKPGGQRAIRYTVRYRW